MIQSTSHSNQEYEYFSNPQILQEIKENLSPFANWDENEHQHMVSSISQKIQLFLYKSLGVQQQQGERVCSGVCELMEGLWDELRQKSSNLVSVASLSIKMIDFITEQSSNYYQSVEDYQLQVDRLQNVIHDLHNKNNIIETDVELFKEQLEAARNELDQITEQQEDIGQPQEHQDLLQSMRQSRIQSLECELQKMRAQLSYYKASGLSRGSLKCEEMGFKNTIQTKSLFYLNQKDNDKINPHILGQSQCKEDTLVKYSQKNKQLEEENQKLRIQIHHIKNKCSRQSLKLQQNRLQRSKSLVRVKTSKNIHTNNSSSFFDFAEFFTLLKSKHQEKIENICQEREAELEQLQTERKQEQKEADDDDENVRHLSSQWSRCSLGEYNHPQLYQPTNLVYLTQESQDIHGENSNDFFFDSPTKISVSRQTEASFESVGINTVKQTIGVQVQEKKEGWMKRMLKGLVCNSYVDRVRDLVVTRRIKQKLQVVNRGALQLSK